MSIDNTLKSPVYYIELAKHLCECFTADGMLKFEDDPDVRVNGDGKILVQAWIVLEP